jgi:predicted nucleotidyltransferase
MNPNDPNVQMIELVAHALEKLTRRFTFVGGCAAGLLITDPARPQVRATKDVDVIVEIVSLPGYYEVQKELKGIGFREDAEVTCRWRLGELKVDVMPTSEKVLGFSNRWYPKAAQLAQNLRLPSGREISLVSAPLFLATKLEAFHGRGNNDYGSSHDIEDIVTVVDGRAEITDEVLAMPDDVRSYLQDEFDDLLTAPPFLDTLSWHFAGDEQSQSRIPHAISRMRGIAEL